MIAHLILHRARRRRESMEKATRPLLDPKVLDELERHDVAIEVGIANGTERVEDADSESAVAMDL
jgi:hypothetical protein